MFKQWQHLGETLEQNLKQRPFHCLNIVTDSANWSLDHDARMLKDAATKLGRLSRILPSGHFISRQCIHFTSQFMLMKNIYGGSNRLSVDYYHGMPGTEPLFDQLYAAFVKNHKRLAKVRVSHRAMEDLLKNSGVDPHKVIRIPLGVDVDVFVPPTLEQRTNIRRRLDIPLNVRVIGSFQKDGSGWGEGLEPKPVKGPDIFLNVIRRLKGQVDALYVLLTGPSRGFVKKGLEALGVPYHHVFVPNHNDIAPLYHALDAYLVCSRDEGGPKAILESMASHVPIVTSRVGQAADLVVHGQNGWMRDCEDIEGLAKDTGEALAKPEACAPVLHQGRLTAERNSYAALLPLWRGYLDGFLEED